MATTFPSAFADCKFAAVEGILRGMKRPLLALGLLALGACQKTAPPQPSPSPAPSATPVVQAAPPLPAGAPVSAPVNVEAPAQVNLDPRSLENQSVKEEVLKRIDLMPELTPEEKDKLYVQVDRARAMGKVITIPFPSGRRTLDSAAIAALGEKLALPGIRKFSEDPTVVFVVLGFADKKGDPKENQEISLQRANAVLDVLRDRYKVMNVMHAVGMGSSEMFDAKSLDKNRVVELWAVLP
jgi:outer membrane protein OmpA-like peptidoglycan-associated protein